MTSLLVLLMASVGGPAATGDTERACSVMNVMHKHASVPPVTANLPDAMETPRILFTSCKLSNLGDRSQLSSD